jgi:hypothetical protein
MLGRRQCIFSHLSKPEKEWGSEVVCNFALTLDSRPTDPIHYTVVLVFYLIGVRCHVVEIKMHSYPFNLALIPERAKTCENLAFNWTFAVPKTFNLATANQSQKPKYLPLQAINSCPHIGFPKTHGRREYIFCHVCRSGGKLIVCFGQTFPKNGIWCLQLQSHPI